MASCLGDDSYKTKDSELHLLGKQVISLFADIPVENIHTVEVGRQWENIDIWAEINDDTFLAIEDKTGTSIHDDQLKRYKQTRKILSRQTAEFKLCIFQDRK